jgi:hypothetical protein
MALALLICLVLAIAVLIALLTNDVNDSPREAVPWRIERGMTWTSVALGVAAAVVLVVMPFGSGVRSIARSDGSRVTERFSETLLGMNGIDVLPLLVGPVLLATLPLFRGSSHQRRVRAGMIAVLLVGFCLLSGFSIGLFYAPSALAMLAVALVGMMKERG